MSGRVRKRPVSFGNPSLAVFFGSVYTGKDTILEGVEPVANHVAMVDVPPEQVPEGVLNLLRPHRAWIQQIRIVISETLDDTAEAEEESTAMAPLETQLSQDNLQDKTYLILISLCDEPAVKQMLEDLDGKPYTTLDETQVSHVHPVLALEGQDGVSVMSPLFASQASDVLHAPDNCPVCLEPMEPAILTTVCNHSFHMDCLRQWQDSPCPVCRYDHSGLNDALSQCHVCGTTDHNYVCLICGVVSCSGGGRAYRPTHDSCQGDSEEPRAPPPQLVSSHAKQHYDETLHAYALDTESQHVWDFAGQGYVHRLLQNKDDGKLVEVGDPSTTSDERTLSPGLSDTQEGELVHRKLEAFASQYYTLLKSQMEQQRIYYEGRLEELRREQEAVKTRNTGADLIAALKQERNQLAQRLGTLTDRHRKVQEDVSFLTNMNESLLANQTPLKEQIASARKEMIENQLMFEECLPPLQEKVTTLMLQLESSFEDAKPAAR